MKQRDRAIESFAYEKKRDAQNGQLLSAMVAPGPQTPAAIGEIGGVKNECEKDQGDQCRGNLLTERSDGFGVIFQLQDAICRELFVPVVFTCGAEKAQQTHSSGEKRSAFAVSDEQAQPCCDPGDNRKLLENPTFRKERLACAFIQLPAQHGKQKKIGKSSGENDFHGTSAFYPIRPEKTQSG